MDLTGLPARAAGVSSGRITGDRARKRAAMIATTIAASMTARPEWVSVDLTRMDFSRPPGPSAACPDMSRTFGNPADWWMGTTSPVAASPGHPGFALSSQGRRQTALRRHGRGGSSGPTRARAAGGQPGDLEGGRSMAAWYQLLWSLLRTGPLSTTPDGISGVLQNTASRCAHAPRSGHIRPRIGLLPGTALDHTAVPP